MDSLIQDVRQAARSLRRSRGLTAVAIGTLALGIGASTAVFSAMEALLVRPLPVEDAERLVVGYAMREGFDPFWTSLLEYSAYRRESRSFLSLGLAAQRSANLTDAGEPERVRGAAASAEYLETLGVRPRLGRLFTVQEDRPGGPPVILLSDGLWRRRFGGDRDVVGRAVRLDGRKQTVVGVLPAGFDMPFGAEVWTPLQIEPDAEPLERRAVTGYQMVARRKPGVSIESADAELKAIAKRLETDYPAIRRGWSYRLVGLRQDLLGDLPGRIRQSLFALAAGSAFLVLICCANVAGLLLVRGVARQGEVAIRRALGAGRRRLFRQRMIEGLLLALAGGAGGVLIAHWLLPLLEALNPIAVVSLASVLSDFRIDGRVLAFGLALSGLTGLAFGSLPAWIASRESALLSGLRSRDARSGIAPAARTWLGVLVAAEIAVAVTLLVGGGLLLRSFRSLQRVEPGFRPDGVLVAELSLSHARYPEIRDRQAFTERLIERVRALPGVVAAGTTTNIPLQLGTSIDAVYTVEGKPQANPAAVPITALRLVSPGYLETLGVTLVRGRLLSEEDRSDRAPVAVVTEELARQAWPGEDPIGRRLRRGRLSDTRFPWRTVVGVVRDVKEDRFNFRIRRPALYVPYAQDGFLAGGDVPLNLAVRTSSGDPASLAGAIREAVRGLDAQQPFSNVRTMREHFDGVLTTERFSAALTSALAPLGLLLAALGLYAVMAYSVSQRTREIGLRMALGARPRDVLRLVLGRGLLLSLAGLAVGLAGARALTRVLSGALYDVRPTDLATYGIAAAAMAAIAAAACLLPARRAMRVDPMSALRRNE